MGQNYLQFNNRIHQQENRVSMGGPTSGILSEIFMQDLEDKHFEKKIKIHNIKFLSR